MNALQTEVLAVNQTAMDVADLGELLRRWADQRPNHLAFTYLGDDEVQQQRTYGQLHERATQIAGYLQHELEAGDRALRIPTRPEVRSLNLASAVAVAAYEALRQLSQ